MGEFFDKIKEKHDAPEAVAHRVALYLSEPDRRAIIIESGDDLHFYSVISRRIAQRRSVEFFPGHGRPKVFRALNVLTDLGKMDRAFAIVDRDFNIDDPPLMFGGHCAVLDVYSYENYFGDADVMLQIAKTCFALEPGSSHLSSWSAAVATFIPTLSGSLQVEHAMAFGCRLTNSNCNLSNFKVGVHLEIDATGVVSRRSDTTERFVLETSIDQAQMSPQRIACWEKRLGSLPWQARFRGHYFWEMFVKFLNEFRSQIDLQLIAEKKSRTRTRGELTARHVLEAATPFVPIPTFLNEFLTEILR